jgi:hypothetical protein
VKNTLEIPVSVLKLALPGLGKVVSKTSHSTIFGCVRACRTAQGELSLQTTDIDTAVTYSSQLDPVDQTRQSFLHYPELAKVVKGCGNGGSIHVRSEGEKTTLLYPVGNRWLEQPIPTFHEQHWPVLPSVDTEPVNLAPDLPQATLEAFGCASDDPSRPGLNGAWLDVSDPKAHYVMASNGRMMFTANSFTLDLKASVLLPARKFLTWPGFFNDGPWKLFVGPKPKDENGWLKLQSDHWTLLAPQIDSECPNWRHLIPSDFQTRVSFSDNAVRFLLAALPKLPGANKVNRDITFKFNQRLTSVSGQDNDNEACLDVDGVRVEGKPITIHLNRELVAKALKLGMSDLALVDELTPVVFTMTGKRLVIMPLRPEGAKTSNPTSAPGPVPASAANTEEPANNQPKEEPVKALNRLTQPSNATPPTPTPTPTTPTTEPEQASQSALKLAMEKLEGAKEALKKVAGELTDINKLLLQAQREKRTMEREMEDVRSAVQSVQRIKI